MRRKITEKLLEWKKSGAEKKCLVVRGARQIGKTYSIDQFAKENYSRYYRLDLHEDVEARTIFDGNLDSSTLIMSMSAFIPGFDIVPGDTLIFIDEIQDCPNARASLKFLSGNLDFDVIASGSLMGLRTKGKTFIPVGSEENLYMNPMDFEEFLWALGVSDKVMEHIRAHVIDMRPLEESVFQSMSQYLRWYMIVGGMPEAVRTFVDSKMFSAVRKVQRDLLQGYQDDIGSYAEDSEKDRVERCFDSIAAQLLKDNKTFVYSDVQGNPGYCVGSKYFGYALNWLGQSHLSLTCDCVTQPQLPLEQVTWGTITCYMAGIGSVITAYLVCMYCQGKVNPLTYTYAMLCGPVAIGAPLLSVGPWGALLIGIIAGAVSALCFIYLQPVFCKKLGILDVMGVHNLHGVGGWMGAIFCTILIFASGGSSDEALATIAMAVIVCVLSIVVGAIIGVIMKVTRGEIDGFATDDVDFIKNEEPVEEAAPAAQ